MSTWAPDGRLIVFPKQTTMHVRKYGMLEIILDCENSIMSRKYYLPPPCKNSTPLANVYYTPITVECSPGTPTPKSVAFGLWSPIIFHPVWGRMLVLIVVKFQGPGCMLLHTIARHNFHGLNCDFQSPPTSSAYVNNMACWCWSWWEPKLAAPSSCIPSEIL